MATTTHFNLPKPDATKDVDEEFYQLQSTLDLLDSILKTLQDAVNAKAASSHTHAISEVVNLATELAAKMPASQTFALDDLTNVSGAAAAPNGYVLVQSALGWLPSSPLAALGTHGHLISEITGLVDALAGKVGVVPQSFTAAEQAQARANIGAPEVFGQCFLAMTSTSLLTLSRRNGKFVTIGGVAREIPSAGVTLAVTGLSANTNYYVYAFMSGSTMTLEASTTGRVLDTSTGMWIKSGDASRTLVGLVRVVAGPLFVDTPDQRFVRSWFNERNFSLLALSTGNWITTSNSWTITSSVLDLDVVLWQGEQLRSEFSASGYLNTTGVGYVGVGFDAATPATVAELYLQGSLYQGLHIVADRDAASADGLYYSRVYIRSNTGGDTTTVTRNRAFGQVLNVGGT